MPERACLSPTHTRDVHYGYDLRDLMVYARFDSPTGEGVFNDWDQHGRLLRSELTMDGVTRTLLHRYDNASRRRRLTHPDGWVFTYVHDAAGALTGVYDGIGTAVPLATFSYNPQGLLQGRSERGGSSAVAYGYDALGRLTSLADSFAGGGGNVTLGFSYNEAGQIVRRERDNDAYAAERPADTVRGYVVNGLNQYTEAGSSGFAYDANGNLVPANFAGARPASSTMPIPAKTPPTRNVGATRARSPSRESRRAARPFKTKRKTGYEPSWDAGGEGNR